LNYIFENKILEIHFSKIFFLAAKGAKSVPYNERRLQVLKWVKKKESRGRSGDLVVRLDRPDHKLLRWVLIHGYISEEGEKVIREKMLGDRSKGKMDLEEFLKLKDKKRKSLSFNF
jgi:hypothetical protein